VSDLKDLLRNKYNGVIFDLDQTLANTEDFNLSHPIGDKGQKKYAEWYVWDFLKPQLKIISWSVFQEVYFQSRQEIKNHLENTAASHNRYLYIQRTLENLGLQFCPKLVYKATQKYWGYIIQNAELFPFVNIVLKRIKYAHMKIGVVSDLTADIQIRKLKKLNIAGFIDYLVTSEETLVDKPHPRPIRLLLEKMELEPKDVILVGNNPKSDIKGAENVGIRSFLFDFYDKYPDFEGEKIDKFPDLLKILEIDDREYNFEKLFVSDLFGTLTVEGSLCTKTVRTVLDELEVSCDTATLKKNYELYKVAQISNQEFWTSVGVTKDNIDKAESLLLNKIKIRPKVRSIIETIAKNFNTAIISNVPLEWGDKVVEKFDLEDLFDAIIFSGKYKLKKPDPKIYRVLLSKFENINPSNVFYLDNELGDLKPTKNLMFKTIWLDVKTSEKVLGYIPNFVIQDVDQILDIIELN
jgi:putative hydrolase of the HAD superfamily